MSPEQVRRMRELQQKLVEIIDAQLVTFIKDNNCPMAVASVVLVDVSSFLAKRCGASQSNVIDRVKGVFRQRD